MANRHRLRYKARSVWKREEANDFFEQLTEQRGIEYDEYVDAYGDYEYDDWYDHHMMWKQDFEDDEEERRREELWQQELRYESYYDDAYDYRNPFYDKDFY
jgi:hypothetical protein